MFSCYAPVRELWLCTLSRFLEEKLKHPKNCFKNPAVDLFQFAGMNLSKVWSDSSESGTITEERVMMLSARQTAPGFKISIQRKWLIFFFQHIFVMERFDAIK